LVQLSFVTSNLRSKNQTKKALIALQSGVPTSIRYPSESGAFQIVFIGGFNF
jgi:hypothetical protein